jgi:heme/copper-type cytochrome/quinol oxidase subunit 3
MKSADPGVVRGGGQIVSNSRLGMMLFVASEVMLFGGLMAGFLVLRFGSGNFDGMQRLPIGAAGINTVIILASSLMLILATRGLKRRNANLFRIGAVATFALGMLFLGIQCYEWNLLMRGGMLPSSSIYGGIFYLLTWAHGLHVLGGVVILAVLAIKAWRNAITLNSRNFVAVASIYWHFVTLVWVGLFLFLFVF